MKQFLDKGFSYLIDTMVYDQSQYPGPPRSVPVDEIEALFGNIFYTSYWFNIYHHL